MFRKLLLLALLSFTLTGFAQQQVVPFSVTDQLAEWRAYYDQQSTWPRSHGWKPFKRFEWDMLQRSYRDGTIPSGAMWEAFQSVQRMSRSSLDEPWINLGPYNHGGRTRVLRFHPEDPTIMFAGAVGGGMWKSIDAGENWVPLTDHLPNLAVGCFEIDPTNPQVMYLGTGEGYFNGDAVAGIGLLKSVDAGVTWNTTGMSYQYTQGQAVLCIDIDPLDGNIVLASTGSGLRRSTNGGQSFTTVLQGNINALVRDPVTPSVMLAGAGYPFGSGVNGVYRSEDGGQSWVRSSDGLPPANQIGRVVLDIYRSNTQIVYAGICGTFNYNGSQMIGVFRSVDNGQSWTQMYDPPNEGHYASQGWYDMAIAVKPDQSTVVLSSGLDCYKSNNSGGQFTQKSWWWFEYGNVNFVHADQHEIVFHPENTSEVWIVTDGGIFKSPDVGENWEEMNNGYVTFQYYAMGNATLDTALAYGGTQDNGTSRYDGGQDFQDVFGGDGGYCVVDYTDDNTIYVEYQNGNRFRSDNGGLNFSEINPGIEGTGAWVTPMVLDPFAHNTIYTSTASNSQVWRSPNQGRNSNWEIVGNSIGGEVQCLEVTPAMEGRIYAGSSSSVFRYDGTGNWINVTGNLPGQWVTRVVPDPYNPDLVYATVSGFGTGHIWKSITAGTAWTDVSGNLPNVPFQDVVVDRTDPNTLYAGGDIGVFVTNDGGLSWAVFGDGLPAARVDDMDMQASSGKLRVATHGRGMWEIATGSALLAWLYPNGGEYLSPGAQVTFRWSGVVHGGNVRVEINRDYPAGAWQSLFNSTPNDGQETWTVSGPESDHVRFRISHLSIPQQTDTSNADTRIVNPALRLVSPNGGETLLTGVRDTIRFERTLVPEPLIIEINRDYPSGSWEELLSNVVATDYALWIVQLPGGNNCRLRVRSSEQPALQDESDGNFVLRAPQITVTAPLGGEQIPLGLPFTITWQATEHEDRLRILLNRNYPGGVWEIINSNAANDGSHPWVPQGAPSEHCRIRLVTLLDPSAYVDSPADFTILGVAVGEDNSAIPVSFRVSEPYPNPFNPLTEFEIELPARVELLVEVFNRLGQQVAVLHDGVLEPGIHHMKFDGSDQASGVYFFRITAGAETVLLKAAMIK